MTIKCLACGLDSEVRRSGRKLYCGAACRNKAWQKVNRKGKKVAAETGGSKP